MLLILFSYTEYVDTRELLRIFNSVDAKITTLTNKKKNLELEKEEKDVLKDWELYKDLGYFYIYIHFYIFYSHTLSLSLQRKL